VVVKTGDVEMLVVTEVGVMGEVEVVTIVVVSVDAEIRRIESAATLMWFCRLSGWTQPSVSVDVELS